MDYEQKYKELVGKIEKAYLYAQTDSTKAVLEEIRPELKSEDERIRRFLHHTFTALYLCKDKLGKWHGEPVVNILAWLEKQGDKSFNYENANIQQDDFAPKSQRMVSAEAKEALYGKPVWSEEDEKMYLSIMSVLLSTIGTDKTGFTVTREMNWLKSLKERYTWKPSDEQIEALEHFVRSIGESGYASPYDNNTKLLYSLLEQLKKLKEK